MFNLRKVHRIGITKFRDTITGLKKTLSKDEIICVQINGEDTYALVHWESLQAYLDVVKTIQDPYMMLEFSKFLKDAEKPKAFMDIMRPYYERMGYIDKYDDVIPEGKKEDE